MQICLWQRNNQYHIKEMKMRVLKVKLYKIKKGTTIPQSAPGRRVKGVGWNRLAKTLAIMEVGDRITVKDAPMTSTRSTTYQYGNRTGKQFVTTPTRNQLGVNIWRTA